MLADFFTVLDVKTIWVRRACRELRDALGSLLPDSMSVVRRALRGALGVLRR
jgi:hypothetical protein